MLKKWLPHVATLALAALLVITQHVWADPIAERLTSTATGSSKTTINYQGCLTDSNGDPVNGTPDMVFRLYNVESGDTALWTEPQNGVLVTECLFSVLLGSVESLPQSLFAQNDSLWLGITVGGDEEMTPREKLASAPYALAGGLPSGVIVMWSGSLSAIPEGWSLCDGTNGTPNLLDRFVVGVPDTVTDPGDTGGSHTKTLTIDNIPPHTHSLYKTGAAPAQTTGVDIVSGSCDDYTGYIGYTGSGTAFDIRPQYYEIAFIMKD